MARFRLATNEQFVRADGSQHTHTEWHSIVAWHETASYVERTLRCGSLVRVEGRLRSRQTTDPVTLTEVKSYEIIAETVQLLSNDSITTPAEKKHPIEPALTAPLDVDNLPF